jgi:hypothetical protein
MRFVKRLIKFAFVMLLLMVLVTAVVVVRSRQQPEWYAQVSAYDPAQAAEAARQVQQKLQSTWAWVSDREAADRRAAAGDTRPPLSPVPSPIFTVTFSEQELNAFFQKWKDEQGWEDLYSAYVSNPAIVLHDGRLILAGSVKEIDRVVSFHFRPTLDGKSSRLTLDLDSVMAGRLPMPQALFERYRQKVSGQVAEELPLHQEAARLRTDGSVNESAMNAAIGQLMLSVLNRTAVEPVLFLAGNQRPGGDARLLPVRLVDFRVEGSSVTLSVEMMTPDQRQAWMKRLQGPFGKDAPQVE